MTEEQAKTKWCPMVRTPVFENGQNQGLSANDPNYTYSTCLCIASDCMMWRITKEGHSITTGAYKDVPSEGYCGLAGKL